MSSKFRNANKLSILAAIGECRAMVEKEVPKCLIRSRHTGGYIFGLAI